MRILLRAGRPPHDESSSEAAVAWSGGGYFSSNTGNMLVSDAVYRLLKTPTTQIVCDAYVPESRHLSTAEVARINNNFDAYVLPLSNALRPGFSASLENLTAVIEQLTIPVIVACVGGNVLSGDSGQLRSGVREVSYRFVRAILDHSAAIGVRGEITRTALLKLGFHDSDIEVVGTPAMYDVPHDMEIVKTSVLSNAAKLSINLNPDFPGMDDFYRLNEEHYPSLTTIFQTVAAANLLLWGKTATAFPQGIPREVSDAAYRENRLRLFTNPRPWKEYVASCDFVFGPRLHGAVAALSVGTPAFLLTVDSRTQEVADYHAIPHMPFASARETNHLLASDLYDMADFTHFNARFQENREHYLGFLERCGLEHIYQPGKSNEEYETLLRRFSPAPAVTPLTPSDPAALATRLNWLRQDRDFDHWRPFGAFVPEFELYKNRVQSPQKAITRLQQRQESMERRMEAQRYEIVALAERIQDLQEENKKLLHAVSGLEGNFLIRTSRRIKGILKRSR